MFEIRDFLVFLVPLVVLLGLFFITFIFLAGRSRKRRELEQAVATQGWDFRRIGTTDYEIRGKQNGRSWKITYVNYDLRVTWETAQVVSLPYVISIAARNKQTESKLYKNALGLMAAVAGSGRGKLRPFRTGSYPFRAQFVLMTNAPDSIAAELVPPELEELLLRLPQPLAAHLGISYLRNILYVTVQETREYSVYDLRIPGSLTQIGTAVVESWDRLPID